MRDKELIKKAVDTIRVLSSETITHAGNGHGGIALGAAPLMYAAYSSMKFNPQKPDWFNRDRFVMSAGHGSALLYATLHLFGFDVTIEDLKKFRKFKSRTPGHPELHETPGVDCSTGPLGQGVAMAVGIAMAEKKLATMFNKKEGAEVVDHYTYCVAGDGCLMEGVSYEACNLAGLNKLNKLILLYDKNDITLDGPRVNGDGECIKTRFEACGWNVIEVADANDAEPILAAIAQAKASASAPTIIICKTTIGFEHKTAGTSKAHGVVLTADENVEYRKKLGLPGAPFSIDKSVAKYYDTMAFKKQGDHKNWQAVIDLYKMEFQEEYKNLCKFIEPKRETFEITAQGKEMAGRDSGHQCLNQIAKQTPRIYGANADISSTTKAFVVGGDIINCGVREFAMAAICNGLALHGFTPYCSTFLAFNDYCRPAIRLSALMGLPVTYVFSHDGLGNCPDGPTHQGNEHISALRLIPNMMVFRPCDDYETAESYKWVFENETPACMVLGRGSVPLVSDGKGTRKGGYAVLDCDSPAAIMLSSGAEVSLCIAAAELLAKSGISVRVVSMPSFELFDAQPQEYRHKTIRPDLPQVAVEMGRSDLWYKYLGSRGVVHGFDTFGYSAPQDIVMQELGFTPEKIARLVMDVIKSK